MDIWVRGKILVLDWNKQRAMVQHWLTDTRVGIKFFSRVLVRGGMEYYVVSRINSEVIVFTK